jgi:arylsulfatase A-like enzyme
MPDLSRREVLKLGAAAVAVPAAAALGQSAAARPNVVFILSDDQRHDTIAALGNRQIRTPSLDRLVRDGTAFTRAHIMGGWSGAVSVPSRAMILTGKALWRVTQDLKGATLWPEVFAAAGYATYATGKWHNGAPSFARAFNQAGGPIFFGGMSNQGKVAVHDFDPTGKYAKANERIAEQFSTTLFTDAAVKFLRDYKGEKPFFLYVAYTSPHDPRTPPPPYDTMYQPDEMEVPKNFLPEHPFDNGELKVRDEQLAPWPRTPPVVQRHIADYYGMISQMDSQIGRILDTLEQTGRKDNTIVIFAGDNGLALGQHGLMGKQSVYEHSVRVPLIVAGLGVAKGQRNDSFAYLLDILPTVCELAGVKGPEGMDGRSLAPLLRGERTAVRDSVYAAYRDFQRMVCDGRYKLIKYRVKGKQSMQLFDLQADPWETRNLADDPAQADRIKALTELLHKWQEETGDKERW